MRTIVRACMLGISVLSFHAAIFSQQVAKSIPYPGSPEGAIGFLQFTPPDYGSQKHPLIVFLHGIGERGNGTTQVYNVAANAIPKFCAAGATMRFTVAGVTSSFVVLSPQLSASLGYWPTYYVKQMIAYAKANLQIDTNRIYVCGLSLGGGGVWRLITDTQNFDHTFDGTIAAAAPVCGTQEETDANFCSTIGTNHLPVWAFHSMDDGTVGVGATQHAQILGNICGNFSPAMKFTYYQSGGHAGAWIHAYDTGHIVVPVVVNGVVSNFTAIPNLYEWFLSYTRATGNTPPVADAGNAQTITLPNHSATLTGSGQGTNGATISSYSWVKTSGPPPCTINSPNAASTVVTKLVPGTYVFTLTVTDNHGLTSSASVTITVNPAGQGNTPPAADAGNAQTITLPSNSVDLSGSGQGTNGATISSYSWTEASGPSSANINAPNAASTTITGLVQGTYIFTLTVTDNNGLTNSSSVTITVNAAANTAPVADAGNAQTITLPANSVDLSGSGQGTNGATISSYSWTETSGPSSANFNVSNTASTTVTGLVQGTYIFTLTLTDNHGLTNSSSVTITVNAAANTAPVSDAGNAQTITLPANSVDLSGSGQGTNGATISSYEWVQSSGPSSAIINSANAVSTTVTNLVQGTYVFTLTVTDDHGLTASANVTITVNAASFSAGGPIGYIKQASGGSWQACADASSSGRIPIYANSIANGSIVYSDAAHNNRFNGGWNWFSFTPTVGATVTAAFAVFPDGSIHLITNCSGGSPVAGPVVPPVTPPAPPTPPTGNLLGYIKAAGGPYQACGDASSTGRIAVYGSSIANGNFLYTDSAQTQVYNGGWNWYSFTPALGEPATYAFAIYPIGAILLLRTCNDDGGRMAAPATTAEQDEATLARLKDSVIAGKTAINESKLHMYPNPVHTTATVELYSAEEGPKTVNLYNASGMLKAKYTWQAIKGNNVFSLKDVSGLANGLYILDIRDGDGKSHGLLKFLKL